MKAVILAAGQGKRLHPLSLTRSKAMMPIAGKPIVERVLDGLAENGIAEFVIVVSPEDPHIIPYLSQSVYASQITFVDQPERRGMGDALQRAVGHLDGDFILSACDNLVDSAEIGRLLARWKTDPKPQGILALVAVSPEEVPHTGIVALQGDRITHIVEKPSLAQAPSHIASIPLYVFSSQILEDLPHIRPSSRGEYELQDAIQMLIKRGGDVRGVQVPSRLTLTNANDLLAINLHYLERERPALVGARQASPQPTSPLQPPYLIEPGAIIGANCVLGPYIYVESGSVIPDGTVLHHAIVLQDSTILKR